MQDLSWLAGLGAATQLGGQGIEAHQALQRALAGSEDQKRRQAAADRLAKMRTVAELMGQGATMPGATVAPPNGLPSTGTPNLVSPPDYTDESKLDLGGIATRQALHSAVLQAQAAKENAEAYKATHPIVHPELREVGGALYDVTDPTAPKLVQAAPAKPHRRELRQNAAGQLVSVDVETGLGPDGKPVSGYVHQSAPGESPQITSTRKDIQNLRSNEIRNEHGVAFAKSDLRAFDANHPRAQLPLPTQRTAADSNFATMRSNLATRLGQAETQYGKAKFSADSATSVLSRLRAGAPGATPDPEAGLTDADLWEKKRGEGMSAEQATEYVTARKKP